MSRRIATPQTISREVACSRVLLRVATVQPATERRYRAAFEAFLQWAGRRFSRHLSAVDMDSLLSQYIHHLRDHGVGRSWAVNATYGLLLYLPHFRHSLHGSLLDLRGWERLAPSVSYPPLPRSFVMVAAVKLSYTPGYGRRLAFSLILAFHCYLRCGELLALTPADVIRPASSDGQWALSLRRTKTGPNQWVMIEDERIGVVLGRLRGRTAWGCRLFPFAAATLRAALRWALSAIGVSGDFTLHSLRHGGATHDFLSGVSIEDILHRGRWRSNNSARRYIQAARAALVVTDTPSIVQRNERRVLAEWHVNFTDFTPSHRR